MDKAVLLWYNWLNSASMNHIESYIKKINSALQGSGSIKISSFVDDHIRTRPLLHPLAHTGKPDMSALIYSLLRLPPEILTLQSVIMGQSDEIFAKAGIALSAKAWRNTKAVARSRKCAVNAAEKSLAVFIASTSDVEDLVTILTALYIEVVKLNTLVAQQGKKLSSCFKPVDWKKLSEILGERLQVFEKLVHEPTDFEVKLLAGSYVEYSKAVQEWWVNIAASRKKYNFNVYNQPIYFVSSNSHSLINALSGFATKEKKRIWAENAARIKENTAQFKNEGVTEENIGYYLSRFSEKADPSFVKAKHAWENKNGLVRMPPYHHIDIEAQIFSVKDFVNNPHLDKRLGLTPAMRKKLSQSNALILNIAYPLGLSAYHILKEVSENAFNMRGVYIMGKAASLNAAVGDITLPQFVFDHHTRNNIFVHNIFSAASFARYFPKRSIFANQKAVSVHGTFLQNDKSLGEDYKNGYSIIEMEAGPYLNRVYEMLQPGRYPMQETFVIDAPFRLGLAYYVSDTPYNKGTNLGSKRLTWEGLNATYGISLGVLDDILNTEITQFC